MSYAFLCLRFPPWHLLWHRLRLLGHSQSLGTLENLYSVLLGECKTFVLYLSCILIKCTFQSDLFITLLCLQVNCFNSLGCTYRHILVDWSSSIFFPEWSLHKVGWCLGYLLIFHSLSTYAADENNPINLLIYVPGLLGTAAFAFFCFYLLIAVIAGEMMLGLKLVFITIHPMK